MMQNLCKISKKFSAVILAFSLILSSLMAGISFTVNASTIKTANVNGKTCILGDIVYYNDFENEAKREEIIAFAQTEEIDSGMLTEFISEYEFSGTMDAGNIRDRIEKPMPLLKKRSLVNRIVDFIRQHSEKYQ